MCNNPLKGFKYGKTESGKDNYIIRKNDVDHLEVLNDGRIVNVYSPAITASTKVIREFIEIPCGRCYQCRLDYSKRWADRCMLEAQYHDKKSFITLTYDDDHVPGSEGIDPVTGQLKNFKTLRKKEFQDFMKRFRQELNRIPEDKKVGKYADRQYYRKGDDEFKEIRFMACGEYGGHTSRPHYHAIIFGWYPDEKDIVSVGANDIGQSYYSSATLSKVWDKGFNVVADADWNSCAYVARYVVKKLFPFEKDFYEACNIEPEFLLMSRRPGIGAMWYEDNKKCYSTNLNNYISTSKGSHKFSKIKYFDNKLSNEDPDLYEEIKKKRQHFMKHNKAIQKSLTTLPYYEYLGNKDYVMEQKAKALKGKL